MKLVFPRVLVIGTRSRLRGQIVETMRARGFVAEVLDGGIGAMQKIIDESLNTVIIMDLIDAMSPEVVIKLLRDNPRTHDIGIIAFVDPRVEPPDGIDTAFGKGTLGDLTDVIIDVCKARVER